MDKTVINKIERFFADFMHAKECFVTSDVMIFIGKLEAYGYAKNTPGVKVHCIKRDTNLIDWYSTNFAEENIEPSSGNGVKPIIPMKRKRQGFWAWLGKAWYKMFGE